MGEVLFQLHDRLFAKNIKCSHNLDKKKALQQWLNKPKILFKTKCSNLKIGLKQGIILIVKNLKLNILTVKLLA